jgi:hypothetical protein
MSNYILDDKELAFIPIEFKKMVKEEIRMAELKDSGERKIFETGAMRDISEGKGRCDLLPLEVAAKLLEYNPNYNNTVNLYGDDRIVDTLLNSGSRSRRGDILRFIESFMKTKSETYLFDAIYLFCELSHMDITTMLLEVSIHYEDGARKYSENNWKNGIPIHCFIDSGLRHYIKWMRGDQDEPHNRAFIWNLMCAIWTMNNKPDLDDISGY